MLPSRRCSVLGKETGSCLPHCFPLNHAKAVFLVDFDPWLAARSRFLWPTHRGFFFFLTIRTGAMRVVHIPVKTEETQRLRIEFVLYCPICAFNLKIKRINFCRKTKLSNIQCPCSGPHVQQSSLRHSSARIHHKRLSQKNRIHPVSTVSKQPHQVRSPFWLHRKTTQYDVIFAFYRGDRSRTRIAIVHQMSWWKMARGSAPPWDPTPSCRIAVVRAAISSRDMFPQEFSRLDGLDLLRVDSLLVTHGTVFRDVGGDFLRFRQ